MVTAETVEQVAAKPAWPISVDNISPNLVVAEYAVRGEIVKMAADIKKQMEQGQEFPFKKVVMCNIGNPQALGQKPITFFRQVLALCEYPQVGPQARMHWGYSKSRPDHSGALWKPLRGG
mmetsp:Transcript_8862/g.26607  ORF Transcript_8862/g.26607 Transcript_8862/m.26607 type:complete len:120 (-) Transcript_8862:4430-4789(-)